MDRQVFISYSQRDRAVAEAVCAALESQGISCWIAPRDIIPGDPWEMAIIQAIQNCKTMVLVFSSGSNASPDVLQEVRRGHKRRIPIITFRVENIEPSDALAYYLAARQWLDALTDRMEVHVQQLVNALSAHLFPASARHPETSLMEASPPTQGKIPAAISEFRVAMSGSGKGLARDWTGFCRRLGVEVAQRGYCVIATNARSVGRAFYEGACESLVSMGVTDFTNRCRLMQLSSDDPVHRQGIRRAFLGNVHVCLFVGGSAGTREEYQIVRAAGGFAVPIGASGGAAREFWDELAGEYKTRLAPGILQAFLSLGNVQRTDEEHARSAVEIVEALFPGLMIAPRHK